MRVAPSRLPPLRDDEMGPAAEALVARFRREGRDYNVARTFARHPASFAVFLPWGSHVLGPGNTLGPRYREILILRTGWLCRAAYEWSRHVPIARRAGLSDGEIDRIKQGAAAAGWTETEAALLRAADALVADHFIPDDIWAALATQLSEHQLIDAVLTVGQYVMVSIFLNTAGVPLDADVTLDADWQARA